MGRRPPPEPRTQLYPSRARSESSSAVSGSTNRLLRCAACAALTIMVLVATGCSKPADVRVGSKAFPESVILGEMARGLAESTGATAEHKASLGDTSKAWNALLLGDIDVYCEYTGTLTQEILAGEHIRTDEQLRQALAQRGLRMSKSLGFSDNYALAMKEKRARDLDIETISDLSKPHKPELTLGLSNQFLEREDGWKGLKRAYGLPFRTPDGIEHDLAYRALEQGNLDVIDVYTTDAQIRRYGLRVLRDNKGFFPAYEAVLLYRDDLVQRQPQAVAALLRLEGSIPVETMQNLNARAVIERVPEQQVAADFLAEQLGVHVAVHVETLGERLLLRTGQHLRLVAISLALAILIAVPLGIVAAHRPALGQFLLGAVAVVQTLPALALLGLLLLLLHRTGPVPAIVALFLYSLLPIVRNTYVGLRDVPIQVRESAEALGLSPFAQLYLIELPLASRAILAGIKTAAVINVGYATLGGLIGAGGYGQAIITGLNKDDHWLIAEGAIPAVLMALAVQGLFELAERFLVPRGLRLRPTN